MGTGVIFFDGSICSARRWSNASPTSSEQTVEVERTLAAAGRTFTVRALRGRARPTHDDRGVWSGVDGRGGHQ